MEEKGKTRALIQKMLKIFLIAFGILVVAAIAFTFFKIDTDGRHALREAKNVKLALRTIDIEYYGKGSTVYNPESMNGLSPGVIEEVRKLMPSSEGEVTILSYDKKKREITGLLYITGHYQIIYLEDKDKTEWSINYMWQIANFVEDKD